MPQLQKSSTKPDEMLLQAARAGNLKGVRDRIAAGADVNATGKREPTAIFAAIEGGKLEIVQALIAAGADLNRVTYPTNGASVESTPVCYAIHQGSWELAQALVQAGADIAVPLWDGHNAASEAADQATNANDTLTDTEDDWFGPPRTEAVLKKARVEHARWMQFVREAIAQGIKVRHYSLWNAVNSRHSELALLLIAAGVDPNTAPHGTSVLVRAIEHGSEDIALALIKARADIKTPMEIAPLLSAAQHQRISLVLALLDAGADINVVGDISLGKLGGANERTIAEGATALIVATRLGNLALVKMLLERGADAAIGDKHGTSALAWALQLNQPEIIACLRKAGAPEPEYLEGSLNTALWSAAKSGDVAKVEMLLQRGAKPDEPVEDRQGRHFALVSAAREGHVEAVRVLLRHQANVNIAAVEDWAGVTPLMMAARQGHAEVLKALLAAGASLEAKDIGYEEGGETAMHYAARGGHAAAVQTLIAAGAKVNAKAKGGRTPLQVAVEKKQVAAVEALLAGGANANAGPSDGSGPLYMATMNSDLALVKLLLSHGASPVPLGKQQDFQALGQAASKGALEIVKLFLEAGAPINGRSVLGDTALLSAALYGHAEVIRFLLDAGADPNLASRDGFTALMGVVRKGNEDLVILLLHAGADATAVTSDGRTTLKMAEQKGNQKIIALIQAAVAKAPPPPSKTAKVLAKRAPQTATGGGAGDADGDEDDDDEIEPPDFSEAAAKPEFQAVLREVEQLCGAPAKPLGDLRGGYSFAAVNAAADKLLAAHHERLLQKGAYFFRHNRDATGIQDSLGLLPTRDWADLIHAFQTNGANYDLMPADIVKWLRKLAAKQSFTITGVSWDWLEGRLTGPVKDSRKLAHQMYDFCPDMVDQGIGSVKHLAQTLEKDGYFFFWWD